jgi:hypothetical protein
MLLSPEKIQNLLWATKHITDATRWSIEGGRTREEIAYLLELSQKHVTVALDALGTHGEGSELSMRPTSDLAARSGVQARG